MRVDCKNSEKSSQEALAAGKLIQFRLTNRPRYTRNRTEDLPTGFNLNGKQFSKNLFTAFATAWTKYNYRHLMAEKTRSTKAHKSVRGPYLYVVPRSIPIAGPSAIMFFEYQLFNVRVNKWLTIRSQICAMPSIAVVYKCPRNYKCNNHKML